MDTAIPLLLWRGLQIGSLWLAFGSLVAIVAFDRPSGARWIKPDRGRAANWLAAIGFAVALATLPPWFKAAIGDDGDAWSIAATSGFGHLAIGRGVAAAVALSLVLTGFPIFAILPASLALASEAMISHAGAGAWPGLIAETLHILAGGAWIGALPALFIALRRPDRLTVARRFGGLGTVAIAVLATTAVFLAYQNIGSVAGLLGTEYGRLVVLKSVLFGGLVGLAGLNRFRWTRQGNIAALRATVMIETFFGLGILTAAIYLSSLVPAMHEQPVWPFRHQFSFDALRALYAKDPELARRPLLALAALVLGVVLLVYGVIRRRWGPALVVVPIAAVWAVPQLSLLLPPASPTTFYVSPTGFAASSIVAGQAVFAQHCADCHGAAGHGDGPVAVSLQARPADLTAAHLLNHTDGVLFGWLTDGIAGPDGASVMPGFAARLTENQRWAVIDYIRANNAGQAMAAGNGFPRNLAVPEMPLDCGSSSVFSDNAGHPLLIAADSPAHPAPVLAGLLTVHLRQAMPGCVAATEDGWRSYAILAGVLADRLEGSLFLVDAAGWLHPAGNIAGTDPAAAIIAELAKPMSANERPTHAYIHWSARTPQQVPAANCHRTGGGPAARCRRHDVAGRRSARRPCGRRLVLAARRRQQARHRPRPARQICAGLFRLHLLSRCLPDNPEPGIRGVRQAGRQSRPGAPGVHHGRSGARYSGGDEAVRLVVHAQAAAADRQRGRDRRCR